MNTQPVYIGLHIQKCAGTSLQIHLAESARASVWFWHTSPDVNYWQSLLEVEERNTLSRQRAKVIWGHEVFDYFLCLFVGRPIYLFTFLRDPVKRLISWYKYEARAYESIHGNLDKFSSFQEYVLNRQDHMCRFILNRFSHLDDSGSEILCERAISVLEKFAFLGLQEDFTTGANNLMKFMKIRPFPEDMRKNVADSNLDIEYNENEISSINSNDIFLYQYALKRYHNDSKPDASRIINLSEYGLDLDPSCVFSQFIRMRGKTLNNQLENQGILEQYREDNVRKLVFLLIKQCFAEKDPTKLSFYKKTLVELTNTFNTGLSEKDISDISSVQPIL